MPLLAEHSSALLEPPSAWLGTTPVLDLEDTRLRLKVHALTQLCGSDREKVLALYGFVKRMPFAKPFKMRLYTAREVMDHRRGDSADKATLLVAMLRLAKVPARMHFVTLRTEVMHGLLHQGLAPTRPIVQAFLDDGWVGTDSYIYDARYAAAAQRRLLAEGWKCGYGMHIDGQMLWDARSDAFVNGRPPDQDPLVVQDHGVFCDPLEFVSSPSYRAAHTRVSRALHLNLRSPAMDRAIRELRKEGPAS